MAEKLMSAENREDGKQVIDLKWHKEMGKYSHVLTERKASTERGGPRFTVGSHVTEIGAGGSQGGPQIL